MIISGCQKEKNITSSTPQSPSPTPATEKTYAITAIAGSHGSISPETTTVKAGDSIVYTIKADSGYSIASIYVDGANILNSTISGPFVYTFKKVESNHMITIGFIDSYNAPPPPQIDSLTPFQIDSLNNLLTGKWYTKKYEFKIIDTVFHDPWHDFTMPPCEADDYDLYKVDHNYESHQNGTFCSGQNNEIIASGTWNFSPDGKSYILNMSDGSRDTASVVKLTTDSLITLFVVRETHIAWKSYNVH